LDRYSRNKITISEEENQILKSSKVCVVGCGGLGGYIIEMLGRLGVGNITAVDGDVFDVTNLNRQILSNSQTLGEYKALAAKKRMELVNEEVTISPVKEFLTEANAGLILDGHHVIVDALDNISARFIIQEAAKGLNIPFVFGAIAGWYGQVSTIFPGDNTLDKIYKNKVSHGKEKLLGNPAFTPALVSSIQVSEIVKILVKRGELLRNKLLFIDVLTHEYNLIDL